MWPRSLGSQLFVAIWVLALVLITVAVVGSLSLIGAFVRENVTRTLEADCVGIAKYLDMQRMLMARIAESAAATPVLKATLDIEGLDRETATEAADMVRRFADVGFVLLQRPTGEALASTLAATGPLPAIDPRDFLVVVGERPHVTGAAPVNSGDAMVGRLIVGRAIDQAFAKDISELTGTDTFLFHDGRLIANAAADRTGPPTGDEIGALRGVAPGDRASIEIGGVPYVATATPLFAATRVVLAYRVHGLQTLRQEFIWLVASGGFLGGILALLSAALIARRIARPIRALTAAAESFAAGNMQANVAPEGAKETRTLGIAFNAMVRDLEQARRRLIAGERLAAIGQITVTMNHEMNNPLHGLLTAVDLALAIHRENPQSPDLREALEAIQESARQLRSVVQQITTLTSATPTTYVGDTSMIDIHPPDRRPSD